MSETVVLAEDAAIFRRVLQSRLKSLCDRVILAEDGNQAWKLLQQSNTPDLLILDWIMPGIDGMELCRRVRVMPQERYQYVLLLSGKDQKQDVVAGLEAGADDYLTKPFDISELWARLRAGKKMLMLQHELIQAREALRFQATHDDLTGLWSHGATLHLLASELQRGFRSHTHSGVLMIDLDHFKSVNDTYGHLTGDVVLKEAGRRIHEVVRNYESVGRYAGGEFLVVLSNCAPDDLHRIAERACGAPSETPISTDAGDVNVTISVKGVIGSGEMRDVELLSSADTALYEAKRSGRNRVVIGSCDAIPSGERLATATGTQLTSSGIQSN